MRRPALTRSPLTCIQYVPTPVAATACGREVTVTFWAQQMYTKVFGQAQNFPEKKHKTFSTFQKLSVMFAFSSAVSPLCAVSPLPYGDNVNFDNIDCDDVIDALPTGAAVVDVVHDLPTATHFLCLALDVEFADALFSVLECDVPLVIIDDSDGSDGGSDGGRDSGSDGDEGEEGEEDVTPLVILEYSDSEDEGSTTFGGFHEHLNVACQSLRPFRMALPNGTTSVFSSCLAAWYACRCFFLPGGPLPGLAAAFAADGVLGRLEGANAFRRHFRRLLKEHHVPAGVQGWAQERIPCMRRAIWARVLVDATFAGYCCGAAVHGLDDDVPYAFLLKQAGRAISVA